MLGRTTFNPGSVWQPSDLSARLIDDKLEAFERKHDAEMDTRQVALSAELAALSAGHEENAAKSRELETALTAAKRDLGEVLQGLSEQIEANMGEEDGRVYSTLCIV